MNAGAPTERQKRRPEASGTNCKIQRQNKRVDAAAGLRASAKGHGRSASIFRSAPRRMRRDAEGAKALLPRMNAGAPTERPTLRQTNAAGVSFLSRVLGSGEWGRRLKPTLLKGESSKRAGPANTIGTRTARRMPALQGKRATANRGGGWSV